MFAEGFCHTAAMSAEAPRPRASTKRFARVVLDRFRSLGLEHDDEVADAGGPSSTTMTKIRAAREGRGDLPRPRRDAARRIEAAARWAPGSARRVYDGGDPDELDDLPPHVDVDEVVQLLEALPPKDRAYVLEQIREQVSHDPTDPAADRRRA